MRIVVVLIGCLLPAGVAGAAPPDADAVARALVAVEGDEATLAAPCLRKRAPICLTDAETLIRAGDLDRGAALAVGACHAGLAEACAVIAETFSEAKAGLGPARLYMRKACDLGDPESCRIYGDMLTLGRGGPVDAVSAVAYYRRACAARVGRACHDVGLAHAQGLVGPVDNVAAARLYIEACELDAGVCGDAGGRLVKGWGVKRDVARGIAMLERGCRAGEMHACSLLAGHLRDLRPPDLVRAAQIERIACDRGNADACSRIADAKMIGEGTPKDVAGAAADYRRAARGHAERCNDNIGRDCAFLAKLHRLGLGIHRDPSKADELDARACRLDPRHCPSAPMTATSPAPR